MAAKLAEFFKLGSTVYENTEMIEISLLWVAVGGKQEVGHCDKDVLQNENFENRPNLSLEDKDDFQEGGNVRNLNILSLNSLKCCIVTGLIELGLIVTWKRETKAKYEYK